MRILIVEDDDHVASALELGLQQHGHDVTRARTGAAAPELARTAEFVLLDLGLPDLDGYEVCRRIRRSSEVPIIAVTARSDEIDRVLGLQEGADDYVVKPYGFQELLARIEAVSRRSRLGGTGDCADAPAAAVQLGKLSVDRRSRKVRIDEVELALTRKEFDLLAMLAEDPGAVRGRDEIINQVWDENWFGSTRTLDVHVSCLRTKLGDPAWIETVRGVGFRLVTPDDGR